MRCSYCHDRLSSSGVRRCRDCGTGLHRDCWAEARRCPTLGCAPRPAPAPRPTTDAGPPARQTAVHPLALVALLAVLACILGGAAWEGSSRASEERAREEVRGYAVEPWRPPERVAAEEQAREEVRGYAVEPWRPPERVAAEEQSEARGASPVDPPPATVFEPLPPPPADTHSVYGPPIPR
jgi:hypothetical protein